MAISQFRPATAKDIEAIHRIMRQHAKNSYLVQMSRMKIERSLSNFYCLQHKDRVVGMIAIKPFGKSKAELRSGGVDPAHQGKGFGRRIGEAAIEHCWRSGFDAVFITTTIPRHAQRLGFQPIPIYKVSPLLLCRKLVETFSLPLREWWPTLTGRFVFLVVQRR